MHIAYIVAAFVLGLALGVWAGIEIQESRTFYRLVDLKKRLEHE
jgi:hypothetical protein